MRQQGRRWRILGMSGALLAELPASSSRREVFRIARLLAKALGKKVRITFGEKPNPSRSPGARAARATRRSYTSRKDRRSRSDAQAIYHVKRARARAKARRARRNPATPTLAAAAKVFKRWHGFEPDNVQRTRSRPMPRTLVQLGELVEVVYRSDKWSGKPQLYRHRTKRPHPRLCTGPDARGLYLLGGKTRVTERGLVD